MDTINELFGNIAALREAHQRHVGDGHSFTDRAAIAKEEIRLDARRAAVIAALLALGTGLLTLLTRLFGSSIGL